MRFLPCHFIHYAFKREKKDIIVFEIRIQRAALPHQDIYCDGKYQFILIGFPSNVFWIVNFQEAKCEKRIGFEIQEKEVRKRLYFIIYIQIIPINLQNCY